MKINFKENKVSLIVGAGFFLLGFLSNQWVLKAAFPFLQENITLPRVVIVSLVNISLMGLGVLIVIQRKEKKKIAFAVALALIIFLVSALSSEILIRALMPDLIARQNSAHMNRRDSYVGVLKKPNFSAWVKDKEYETLVVSNSEGFRSSEDYIVGIEGAGVIAVIGDSFVDAVQIEDEKDTFVKLIEQGLADSNIQQVQNYGMGGIGLPHYLQIYRHYAKKHNPTIVVVAIYAGNDFSNSSPVLEPEDTVRPRYEINEEGSIVDILPFEEGGVTFDALHVIDNLFERLAIYQLLGFMEDLGHMQERYGFPVDAYIYEEPRQQDYEETFFYAEWALSQLALEIQEEGAWPIFVLVPPIWTVQDEIWEKLESEYSGEGQLKKDKVRIWLKDLFEELKVDFVDLTDIFRESEKAGESPYYSRDKHLNPIGHRLTTQALLDNIRDHVKVFNY